MQNSIFFIRNVNPLKLSSQWDHSGTNKSGWIRLAICFIIFDESICFNFLRKLKLCKMLVPRQCIMSKFISHYLYLLFIIFIIYWESPAFFFSAIGTSYGTTGSSGKSIRGNFCSKGPWLVYFICLTYCFTFFSVHFLTSLLVFQTQFFNCSNSLVPRPFNKLGPKFSLNLCTISHVKIQKRCIPQDYLCGQHDYYRVYWLWICIDLITL